MENTKIEWATHTFNPWVGCTKVSAACDHCYAEGWAKRTGQAGLWAGDRRRTSEANWRQPLKWNAKAEATGARPRVFCASLADVFDNQVPPEWRMDLFALIECTPNLDWLLLTKRPQNIRKMAPIFWQGPPMRNVWLGTTAENQEEYARRWPHLAAVPAVVRFISYEPALGPLWPAALDGKGTLADWIICGGESGGKAREMDPGWARYLRNVCKTVGIPFFMKQMTKKAPIPEDLMVRQFPEARAGRIAFREEGQSWNAYYALTDTMKGAILLGSIRINIIKEHPLLKEAFIQLMRDVLTHYLEEIIGTKPAWKDPEPAPESERSGHS